ncbi:hypothetical protein VNI00_008112 [Paramarasmius palmivorus]|uniref:Uncharacterized protein n=1 Tax=Paramarasmius palmivorus TaxID=297713 RepID=A0AAW0CZV5_9AGAR
MRIMLYRVIRKMFRFAVKQTLNLPDPGRDVELGTVGIVMVRNRLLAEEPLLRNRPFRMRPIVPIVLPPRSSNVQGRLLEPTSFPPTTTERGTSVSSSISRERAIIEEHKTPSLPPVQTTAQSSSFFDDPRSPSTTVTTAEMSPGSSEPRQPTTAAAPNEIERQGTLSTEYSLRTLPEAVNVAENSTPVAQVQPNSEATKESEHYRPNSLTTPASVDSEPKEAGTTVEMKCTVESLSSISAASRESRQDSPSDSEEPKSSNTSSSLGPGSMEMVDKKVEIEPPQLNSVKQPITPRIQGIALPQESNEAESLPSLPEPLGADVHRDWQRVPTPPQNKPNSEFVAEFREYPDLVGSYVFTESDDAEGESRLNVARIGNSTS